MQLALRPATTSDAKAITDIYFSAWSSDPISLLCFPRSDPTSYTWWLTGYISDLSNPTYHIVVICDISLPSQPIIAYAKWDSPLAVPSAVTSLPAWPPGGNHEIANLFFGSIMGKRPQIMGVKKHWFLDMICVLPEYQGKGAAGMLMRWGTERADDEGVEAYLEASPVGKPVYEHFGFVEVDRVVIPLSGLDRELVQGKEEFVECMMLRPARKKDA